MAFVTDARDLVRKKAPTTWLDLLPASLVVWATFYNGILAILNDHGIRQSTATVVLAEVLAVGTAHLWVLRHFKRGMEVWYCMLGFIIAIFAVKSLVVGELQIKYVRDIMIIPTFILLGMTAKREDLFKMVLFTHFVVVFFMFYEAIDTSGFSKLFSIQNYYINTRGYDDSTFWNKDSDLFVNAVRPQDRIFLPQLNLHRVSSIFLEPVSLGNYCTIITVYLCAQFSVIPRWAGWFILLGNVALIVGCDGRLAALTSVLIVGVCLVAGRLPRFSPVIHLPLILGIVFAATSIGNWHAGGDDFPSRLAHTAELLGRYDFDEMIGLSERFFWQAADSGIAYWIMTQTLPGVVLMWFFITCAPRENTLSQVRFTHGIAIYIATALMVSFSIFTIKTAALLWFMQGVLQAEPVADEEENIRPTNEELYADR